VSDPHPSVCPYCGNEIPNGTNWCSRCAAKITPITGKYPIHMVWIFVTLVMIPFATLGGCIFQNANVTAYVAIGGTSFATGIAILIFNYLRGRS
jgi:predicted nucleic acid-binding Zn ribbon protein